MSGSGDLAGDAAGAPTLPSAAAPAVSVPTTTSPPTPTPPQPTSTPTSRLPSLSGGGRKAPFRGGGRDGKAFAAGAPGQRFQSLVLDSFLSTVSSPLPSLLLPPPSAHVWITPPFRSPCFSPRCVENLLNFYLCCAPERLSVLPAAENVFVVRVASLNVARFVVACGSWQMKIKLVFHLSLDDACSAAAAIQTPEPLPASVATEGTAPGSYDSSPPSDEENPRLARARSPASGVGLEALTAPPAFSLHPVATKRTYLEALLTPALQPAPRSPHTTPPRLSLSGCFRCLSPDHPVRECRDPVRCRECGCSGHRAWKCTMQRSRPRSALSLPQARASPRRPTSWPTTFAAPRSPPPAARPTTPFPASLIAPAARRRAGLSPIPMLPLSPERRASFFGGDQGAGPSSRAPRSPPPRDVHQVVPDASLPHSSSSSEGITEESGASGRPAITEVFMPPGDMLAVRRLAVVYLDPPDGFSAPMGAVGLAFCQHLPRLQIELVPSGIGAMYARFRSPAERDSAVEHGSIVHDGVSISLAREENAARASPEQYMCAFIWASPFPPEHVSFEGVRAAFANFGKLLEVDLLNLSGADLSADAFEDGRYRRFFAPPPPPPFRRLQPLLHERPVGVRDTAASPGRDSASDDTGSRYSPRRHGGAWQNPRLSICPAPRVLLLTAPPPSPTSSPPASPRSSSLFSSADAPSSPAPIAADVDAASVTAADQADEEQWEAVVDSARNRRKPLGRLKREKARQEAAARGV
nr:uncharacterized protein LOC127329753 [Lolium perenne]